MNNTAAPSDTDVVPPAAPAVPEEEAEGEEAPAQVPVPELWEP
jgi:hypothetical protein